MIKCILSYLQILLVSHKHYWHFWIAHHVYNLVIQNLTDLEALEAVDGVYEDIAVDVHCVLGRENAAHTHISSFNSKINLSKRRI